MQEITWVPVLVKVSQLREKHDNPKISTEKGKQRLKTSLNKFGLAGTIIANLPEKQGKNAEYPIIDGHSRVAELKAAGVPEVWVSVPSRMLTKKEFDEMNALYDVAKASDPDMLMIEELVSEETLTEFDLIKEKPDLTPQKVELKPYVRTHILLSFPPEKMIDIQEYLQKIADMPFVELEQANN
jgi:hypothetical protein